jgi:MinD superfamily P-loop ATPase
MDALRAPSLVAVLDDRLCSGCRMCLPACDAHALVWVAADRELFLDSWACTGCGDCARVCPERALTLAPRSER